MKQFFFLAIAMVVGMPFISKAEIPAPGDYYIENVCQWTASNGAERRGLLLTGGPDFDLSNNADSVLVKPFYINGTTQEKQYQIWTLDAEGYLVNKGTQKKVHLPVGNTRYFTDASNATKFTLQPMSELYSSNVEYDNLLFLVPEGAGVLTDAATLRMSCVAAPTFAVCQQNKPGPEAAEPVYGDGSKGNGTGSPRAWRFIPVEKYNSMAPDAFYSYPELSTGSDANWYYIKFPEAEGKVLAKSIDNMMEFVAKEEPANDAQLWKFVSVEGKPGKVYIVNKESGNYIDRSATAPFVSSEPAASLSIKGYYDKKMTIAWYVGSNSDGRNSYGFSSNGTAFDLNQAFATSQGIYPGAIQFVKATTPSGISNITNKDIYVFSKDGYICIDGITTGIPVQTYTLTGVLVDTQSKLPKGVYLVKIENKTFKVFVQ